MATPTAYERVKLVVEICAFELKALSDGALSTLEYAIQAQIEEAEKEAARKVSLDKEKRQEDAQCILFPRDKRSRH